MPITTRCACGKRLKADESLAGRIVVCPACGETIKVPAEGEGGPSFAIAGRAHVDSPALREINLDTSIPSDGEDEEAEGEDRPRPFWRDPVFVIGATVPALILLAFCVFLWNENSQKRFAAEIVRLKAEADGLAKQGQVREAYWSYATLLEYAGTSVPKDPQAQADLKAARTAWKTLAPAAIAAENQLTQARAQEEERRRRAEAARVEAERLSKIRATIHGEVWVETKAGTKREARGLPIFLLRRRVSREEAADVLRLVNSQLIEVGEYIAQNAKKYTEKEKENQRIHLRGASILLKVLEEKPNVDVKELYDTARAAVPINKVKVLDADPIIKMIIRAARVKDLETSVDSKYRFDGVTGGEYLLCTQFSTDRSAVEWMTPVTVERDGDIECNLHNNKAALILNEADDDDR